MTSQGSPSQCPICGILQAPHVRRCESCGGFIDSYQGDPLIGREIGHFVLEIKIGRGGMGSIYRARHKALGTPYAIKLIHPQLASDPIVMERFRREAIAASQLKHDHVVFISDFGWAEGIGAYIVMEYLTGSSLGDALRSGRHFSPAELREIFRQISSALYAAHKRSIVHRDLKPDNIFLCLNEDGEEKVKVLDFGIARIVEEEGAQPITLSQTAVGTPQYMSPEQAEARWEAVDHRTDIYALGVILYRILTGKTPIPKGPTHQVITLKLSRKLTPFAHYRPQLAGTALEAVVERALAHEREDRFADVKEMMEALSEALSALHATALTMEQTSPVWSEATPSSSPNGFVDVALLQPVTSDLNEPPSYPSIPTITPPSFSGSHDLQPPQHDLPETRLLQAPERSPSSPDIGILSPPPPSGLATGDLSQPSTPHVAVLPPREPSSGPKIGNLLLGLLALLAMVGGAFLGLELLDEAKPQSSQSKQKGSLLPPLRKASVPLQKADLPLRLPPPQRPQASPPRKRPPQRVAAPRPRPRPVQLRLEIRSRPRAQVWEGKVKLCKRTPCRLVGLQGRSRELVLRRRGYWPRKISWSADRSERIKYTLKRRRRRRRRWRRRKVGRKKPNDRQGLFDKIPIP